MPEINRTMSLKDTTITSGTTTEGYAEFASEIVETRIISDPWVEGKERFRLEPVILSKAERKAFGDAVESVGFAFNELLSLLWKDPSLLEKHIYLTPWQRMMWTASGGLWHGIARADAFVLNDGSIQICELNADTPSGEPEAVIFNQLRHRFHPDLQNPNAGFRDAFVEMLKRSWQATFREQLLNDPNRIPRVGIIYPTDIPEDLSMIELYKRWCHEEGWSVQLGSPYNLSRNQAGDLQIFGKTVDLLIRHYKTDWWGEREPILYNDEEYLDPEPLDDPLRIILGADVDGVVAIVNPFGSILAQNKATLALLHTLKGELSAKAASAISNYIPYSVRLTDVDIDELKNNRTKWVLKSDFGCEGDEVMIGPLAEQTEWEKILDDIIPERWIAQEFFEAAEDDLGNVPNYGLFLIGGRSRAIFTRFSSTSTDYRAVTAPTFVQEE